MQTNSPNGGNQDSARETRAAQGGRRQESGGAGAPDVGRSRRERDYPVAPRPANPFTSFQQLTREMDEWMSSFFGGRFGFPSAFGARGRDGETLSQLWQPRIDMRRKGDQLLISADLPGIERDSVNIECTPDGIAISGERRESREENDDKSGYHFAERSYGSFYREIPLPDGADGEQAKATMKEGVLEIAVPVKPSQQRRRIEIT
jgi:HSP20 family protein